MHSSLDEVLFTWGKYTGQTLGNVLRTAPTYLQWIISTPGLPAVWVEASTRALNGGDVSDLSLPRAKTAYKPQSQERQLGPISIDLKDAKTAYVVMPYDKTLLEQFKYEIDGRKWNGDERRWEFPAVQLPKMMKTFPTATLSSTAEKLLGKLQTRREDLDAIREKEDDNEYAKQFNNIIKVGKVLNWNELNTNLQIKKFIKK
jgi:hypothetical protein